MRKILAATMAVVLLMLTGCTMLGSERIKLQDLDFTILGEEKLPEELKEIIEERKAEPFHLTYSDGDYLYICVGYGEQATGGYSIAVNELYLTDSAICADTELLGPETPEKNQPVPSYPYIVIKTDYLDQTVMFE